MRLAFLTSRFPYPPDRGDRVVAWHILRALSERNDIVLISFADGTEPPFAREQVQRLCSEVRIVRLSPRRSWAQAWTGLFSTVPSQVSYYQSRRMRDLVGNALQGGGFDVVFVQMFRMAPYV